MQRHIPKWKVNLISIRHLRPRRLATTRRCWFPVDLVAPNGCTGKLELTREPAGVRA